MLSEGKLSMYFSLKELRYKAAPRPFRVLALNHRPQ